MKIQDKLKNFTSTSIGLLGLIVLLSPILNLFLNPVEAIEVPEENNMELEIEYFDIKSRIISEIDSYILSKAPDALLSASKLFNGCEKYKIDVRLALAQGQIESHFGTKGLASKSHSVWNIGAFDNKCLDSISNNHKYVHPNQSIEPYLITLKENYLIDKTEIELLDNFVDYKGDRYASKKDYEKVLKSQIEYINSTTQLDSLLIVYNLLKEILSKQ